MAEEKKCPKCLQHVPLWMVTFADMSSLLMTFFVLLVVLMPHNKADEEMQVMIEMFKSSLGVMAGGNTTSKGKLAEMGMTVSTLPSNTQGKTLDSSVQKAQLALKKEIALKEVHINPSKSGFTIDLMGDLYFEPGSSELKPEAKEVLKKIGDLILDLQKAGNDNGVKVKGYADGGVVVENSGTSYSNNLELTSKRANNVVEYFWSLGVSPTRLYNGKIYAKFQSIGFGEFQPIEANISPEERAYNRRVQIEFLRDQDAY